jgi:hypothetical protein
MRTPAYRYQDPLDLIWLSAAKQLRMRVERTDDAYASWDGRGTLRIARTADFDADDSLAQLIFHEICHALVAGPDRRALPDWGLDNASDRDVVYEHATNRLQAALADRFGLRRFFATTTEYRAYYDSLDADPLASREDPAAARASAALEQARQSTWWGPLEEALRKTAAFASVLRGCALDDTLWSMTERMHRAGFVESPDAGGHCGDCAWFSESGCRMSGFGADRVLVGHGERACVRFEARFDEGECGRCGACCREGFHTVEVQSDEPIVGQRPDLIREESGRSIVPRPSGRCLALLGTGAEPYRCAVYGIRPRSCAAFPIAGDACLQARRRVGLSP